MSSLDYVALVRDAHAMLPIISVSICELVEFALGLVGDVEHRLIVCDHAVFLEADCNQLGIGRVKFRYDLKGGLAQDRGALVCIHDKAPDGFWQPCKREDALLTDLGPKNSFDESVIKLSPSVDLQVEEDSGEQRMVRPGLHLVPDLGKLSLQLSVLSLCLELPLLNSIKQP